MAIAVFISNLFCELISILLVVFIFCFLLVLQDGCFFRLPFKHCHFLAYTIAKVNYYWQFMNLMLFLVVKIT
jgi:hypothetical protein